MFSWFLLNLQDRNDLQVFFWKNFLCIKQKHTFEPTTPKLVVKNNRSPKNGDIVKNKVYERKFDFKRDTTDVLVRKYEKTEYAKY